MAIERGYEPCAYHPRAGPNNRSNALTVPFGVFVSLLVVCGSVWIMTHLSHTGVHYARSR